MSGFDDGIYRHKSVIVIAERICEPTLVDTSEGPRPIFDAMVDDGYWLLEFPDGCVSVCPDDTFRRDYEPIDSTEY